MVGSMDHWTKCTICGSNDMKETVVRFGANPQKILVEDIGSLIADRHRVNTNPLHPPLIIANIGVVSYFKENHVLIEAAARLGGTIMS